MPIATTLPKKNITIRFPPSQSPSTILEESYQLLELPPEILKQVEGGTGDTFPLTIKGKPSDDAVLCTPTSTFLLRTISISNSLLILRTPESASPTSTSEASSKLDPGQGRGTTLEIRDTCQQILECVPQAADLSRIRKILKDSQWSGIGLGTRKRKRGDDDSGGRGGLGKRYTREQLDSVVQASEGELNRGLKENNVIDYQGRMMMLPSKELVPLLNLVLTLLTIHSTNLDITSRPPRCTSPVQPIITALAEDHDIPQDLTKGLMILFGEVEGEEWLYDIKRIVREVGRGLVESLDSKGIALDKFLQRWKEQVGESYEGLIDIQALEGEYLLNPPITTSLTSSPIVVPFPSHNLPLHPPTRFADLFLTRPRWRPEDMAPFLKGLTRDGDTKERDKLVAKFVRVVKDNGGVWWYPRRTA